MIQFLDNQQLFAICNLIDICPFIVNNLCMTNKTDLRIIKTEQALIQALLKLMESKTFDEITVNELCDSAMIRRATFYIHYQDKYDFFAHAVRYVLSLFAISGKKTDESENILDSYVNSVIKILDFTYEKKEIIHSIVRSNMFPILMTISTEELTKSIRPLIERDISSGILKADNADIITSAFTGAFMGVLNLWINCPEKVTKEEIVDTVDRFVRKIYF